MKRLRQLLDSIHPHVEKGARFEKLYAAYEAVDTLLYSPGLTTRTASHVRDGLDLKRMMSFVIVALIPCVLVAIYNTGYQANLAISLAGCGESDWVGRDASDGRRAEQGEGSPFPVRTGSVSHG